MNKIVNEPVEKNGKLGLWGIGARANYYYSLFNERDRFIGPSWSKSFRCMNECTPDIFSVVNDYHPEGIIPFLLGKKEKDTLIFRDLLRQHTLVAGITGSGKTNWLQSFVVSLLHYSHPEYLRVVILDPKGASFSDLEEITNVVPFSLEEIAETLIKLHDVMQERIRLTQLSNFGKDAFKINAYAYRMRNPKCVMPYIVVIFDEFSIFSMWADQNSKRSLEAIKALSSMGRGLGINLMFATQCPYAKFIKGYVKANFERKICFKVADHVQENLILGYPKKGEISATSLKVGELLVKDDGMNTLYKAVLCGDKSLRNAANNLRRKGYIYKLF